MRLRIGPNMGVGLGTTRICWGVADFNNTSGGQPRTITWSPLETMDNTSKISTGPIHRGTVLDCFARRALAGPPIATDETKLGWTSPVSPVPDIDYLHVIIPETYAKPIPLVPL
jgi:hypothetical protein